MRLMNEKRIPISNKESNRIESNRICYFHDISLLFTCHVNVSLSKQRSQERELTPSASCFGLVLLRSDLVWSLLWICA